MFPADPTPLLRAERLSKSFGYRKVLQDLDLTVAGGEIVALIGVNGAGKTTLIRVLATLSRPDSGSVTISGVAAAVDPTAARRNIGVVLHTPMLYANLTCRENLHFYSQLYALEDAGPRMAELLAGMGLEGRADDRAGTLSRGMQQRLSIARAQLHNPGCLLMDEAFTGLDQGSAALLNQLLERAAGEGRAVLFTTHEIEHVFNVATRVDILHKGRIIFSNPVDQLRPSELLECYRTLTTASLSASMRGTE